MTHVTKPLRQWTEAEIDAAIAVIEANDPELMEEWKRGELSGGDLAICQEGKQSVGGKLSKALEHARPDLDWDRDRFDLISLLGNIRGRLRQKLGL